MCKGKDHVHPGQPEQPAEPHDHQHCGGHGHDHGHHPAQKADVGQPEQTHHDHDHHDHHTCGGHGHKHDAPKGQPEQAAEPHHDHDHHGCGGHGHKHDHDAPKGQPEQAAEAHHDHDHHDHKHGCGGHGHGHNHHPGQDTPKGQPEKASEPHHDHDHHGCGGHGHGHHHHPGPDKGQPQQAAEPRPGHDHKHGCGGHGHGHCQSGHGAHTDQPKEGAEPKHDHQHGCGGHKHGHCQSGHGAPSEKPKEGAEPHHDHDHKHGCGGHKHGHGPPADKPKEGAEPHDHDHHNCGGHGHGRPDRDTYAEANREHFDASQKEFENYPHAIERGARTAVALREAYAFDKDKTTVLDFACGTGLVSKELAPYAHSIKGVDISQGMVDRYNEKFATESKHLSAVRVELKDDSKELEGNKFDVIFCASAYHHFSSVEEITRILVSYLKPGGTLLVADMTPSGATGWMSEKHRHIVAHPHGFSEDDVRKLFEGAGLESFSYKQVAPDEGDADLFIAKGVKAAPV